VVTVENYANVHLAHHKEFFEAGDPDFSRKNGRDWTFPMPRWRLVRLYLLDLVVGLFNFRKGKNIRPVKVYREQASPPWVRWAYYAVLAALITSFQLWDIVLIYWIVPLLTVLQLIIRFGAFCEHKYNLLDTTEEDSTPLIILSWWEKALLPNINFTYHIYHHMYVGAPFHCLPKIHRIYQREGLVNEENVFHGYYSYIKFMQDPANA
jgi:fatty acid desaturase